MLNTYINRLIDTHQKKTRNKFNKKVGNVDIVFEAGLFNGSYQIGFLKYAMELERRGIININRLSGSSVGSIIALCYFFKDNMSKHCEILSNQLYANMKKKMSINIFGDLFDYFKKHLPPSIIDDINGKLYITFHDVTKGRQYVKNKYHDIDDLFESIRKSCAIPFVIDNKVLYKNKYFDGLYPYMFNPKKNVRIINLNIVNIERFSHMISIKNEKSNTKRIIEGIMDAHQFFTTKFPCHMCTYVDEWTLLNNIQHYLFIKFLQIIMIIIHHMHMFNNLIKHATNDTSNINYLFKNICLKLMEKCCF